MAKVSLSTIKNWFKTKLEPTQAQFWDTWDSFWHKDEMIPYTQIEKLDDLLEAKADKDEIASHLTDASAHQNLFDDKVDKVAGKGLSANDFTDEYKANIDKCCPTPTPVSINLGAGITARIVVNGDSIKGKVDIELSAIDSKILDALSVVELCNIQFNKPFARPPFVLISFASPTYEYYVNSDTEFATIFTNSYDKTTKELLGIKAYPFTISFYYHIMQ